MTLSLIIPTYRRPEQVSALLGSSRRQSFDPGNLACVHTQEICEDLKKSGMNIQHFETRKLRVNIARNAGLETAKGEICV